MDLIFAVDPISAIYGLTNEAYIVFTANAFALMGLRQLFFLIGGLLECLAYLAQGLAVIAATIAVATIASLLKTRSDENKDGRGQIHGEPVITADPLNEQSEVDQKTRPTAKFK